jgi:hypothetical protein
MRIKNGLWLGRELSIGHMSVLAWLRITLEALIEWWMEFDTRRAREESVRHCTWGEFQSVTIGIFIAVRIRVVLRPPFR